ncbi:YIEGIA family protein [Halonatronum saccharophilum]|uniref:YIEGIA family protein n=1 Tax=Halonatronum saccharophilum TaxID=150060 RepID=UPI0004840471|nr:YIEGIA family protein [Halonatronum saccharophilum]
MIKHGTMILLAVILGTGFRVSLLKVDYRQYPGYPNGYIVHLTFGFIAAVLGSLIMPALIEENYIAVTVLGAAVQQFRDIRNMERDFLSEIEATEIIPRGKAYIEGVAKNFEARNYLALITAFMTTVGYYILEQLGVELLFRGLAGIVLGGIVGYILYKIMSNKTVGDIAKVRITDIEFSGPMDANMGVEGVIMMNIGLKEALDNWKESGVGIVIEPKDDNARATLANIGQRQAIMHDLVSQLGTKLDKGIPDYTPVNQLNLDTGRVGMLIVPIEKDKECIKEAVESTPILEDAKRKPLATKVGRKAAD